MRNHTIKAQALQTTRGAERRSIQREQTTKTSHIRHYRAPCNATPRKKLKLRRGAARARWKSGMMGKNTDGNRRETSRARGSYIIVVVFFQYPFWIVSD